MLDKTEKCIKVHQLLFEVDLTPFEQFFDTDSDELLDEKIEVLTALKEGKTISDIPHFYDILELYPKDGTVHWECTATIKGIDDKNALDGWFLMERNIKQDFTDEEKKSVRK